MSLPDAVNEVIAHFLTDFPPDQKVCKTQDYIRVYLTKHYSVEVADRITNTFYRPISNSLIEEYDQRIEARELLRYRFLDASGERVVGIGKLWQKRVRIFQDALNDLSDTEFESLSAWVLSALGCHDVWVTPLSHDQGLDSFGYAAAFSSRVPREIASQCRVVYLAQAKHYKKHTVGSRDLREFVGSVELAIHKIFSTVDQKYKDLVIKPFGPSIMVFLTTEELPRTVKTIGRNAGIVVLAAQDLAVLFSRARLVPRNRWKHRSIRSALRRSIRGQQKAE
jgi:hypothetical protein